MEHRGRNNFSDVAVENAIQDLKRIQLKEFDNDSLARPSPTNKNCNFSEEDNNNNNNFDDNGNVEIFSESPKSASRMRMAGTGNEATTASCSESESDDPLELLDNFSSNGSGDEGTWLYQSPGSRGVSSDMTPIKNGRLGDGPEFSKRRSKASPLDWLRRDFDQTPSPEVEKARHSLVNKVDEITQGRLDTQTFRIRDSRNQARKSLQELINFSGPHQATSTQTSSHECQTEEAGMQTSFLDETLRNMSPGSTLTLHRSVARNKRHSFPSPNPPIEPVQSSVVPTPPSTPPANSTPRKPFAPPSTPPTPPSLAAGHSPNAETHDSSLDNEVYYEALEYPLVEAKEEDEFSNEESETGSGFVRSPRYRTYRKNAVPAKLRLDDNFPPLDETSQSSPRTISDFDKLSVVEIDIDAANTDAPEINRNDADKISNDGTPAKGDGPKSDVTNLVNDVKSRTFTRPKKLGRPSMEAARESDEESHSADAANATDAFNAADASDTADSSKPVDASFSSAEDGGGEDGAEFPHLPARVDSSTFTRPIRNNAKNKKISRQPLRVVKREAGDDGGGGAEGKEEAEVEEKHPTIAESGDFANDDRFNNNKPKIVGSATVSRSAGRRLQPKLRLNGAPEETPQDEGQDSRSSSPASCSPRPSTGDSPRLLRKTSSTESHPDSRSSPVVWDQSNMDKPADMVDVQVIARMQEDSLRRSIVINRGAEKPKLTGIVQPLTSQNGHAHERGGADQNSSLPSPYSKHGGNLRRIGNGATDEGFSPKPRIGREDSASSMYSVDSNPGSGGVGGGRSGSDSMSAHSGTPPDSPLGGSRSDLQSSSSATRGGRGTARRGGGGGGGGVAPPSAVTRRSLPNLAAQSAGRPQPKAKPALLSSDSNLRDKSGLRQPTPTTSRLKPPASGLRAPSPASAANRSVSPGGIPRGIVSPTPRSVPATARGGSSIARPMRGGSSSIKPAGIPRGGQTSQPRRSGIQVRGSSRNAPADWEEDYY